MAWRKHIKMTDRKEGRNRVTIKTRWRQNPMGQNPQPREKHARS